MLNGGRRGVSGEETAAAAEGAEQRRAGVAVAALREVVLQYRKTNGEFAGGEVDERAAVAEADQCGAVGADAGIAGAAEGAVAGQGAAGDGRLRGLAIGDGAAAGEADL